MCQAFLSSARSAAPLGEMGVSCGIGWDSFSPVLTGFADTASFRFIVTLKSRVETHAGGRNERYIASIWPEGE